MMLGVPALLKVLTHVTAHLHSITPRHEPQFLALAAILQLLGVLGNVVGFPLSIVLLVSARSALVKHS